MRVCARVSVSVSVFMSVSALERECVSGCVCVRVDVRGDDVISERVCISVFP